MGSSISSLSGGGNNENDAPSDSSNGSEAQPVDPGSLYFGTRLFINPNASQNIEPAEDEGEGNRPEGELGALEVLRRVNNTAPFHQTKTLNCPVNLKKQSLSLTPVSPDNRQVLGVQFTFDSCTACAVTVFYACVEVYDKDSKTFKYVCDRLQPFSLRCAKSDVPTSLAFFALSRQVL